MDEKALPGMRMARLDETESFTDENMNTGDSNDIDVAWFDVAETLDIVIGIINIIALIIIGIVFIIIFNA